MRSETVHVFKQMRIFREEKRKIILYLKKRKKALNADFKGKCCSIISLNNTKFIFMGTKHVLKAKQNLSSYPTLPKDA